MEPTPTTPSSSTPPFGAPLAPPLDAGATTQLLITRALPAALLTAAVIAVVWGGLAYLTGYSFGLLAIGLGAACGFVVRKLTGNQRSHAGAATAAVASLLGIVAGNILAVGFLIQKMLRETGDVAREDFWSFIMGDFLGHPFDYLGVMDILFAGLAIWYSWRVAGPGRKQVQYATLDK